MFFVTSFNLEILTKHFFPGFTLGAARAGREGGRQEDNVFGDRYLFILFFLRSVTFNILFSLLIFNSVLYFRGREERQVENIMFFVIVNYLFSFPSSRT